jgi:RNA polymerase sigma factor (sigma-70 family)
MDKVAAALEPLIPHLRRYAYALTRDHAWADDLVQDTLERALSRWYLKRAEGDLKAWLFAILRNQYLGELRRARRRGTHVALDLAPDQGTPPPQESDLTAKDMLAALAQLPEEQQSLLLLIGVENLSYQETARILDLPIGTIMSRLSRARAKLRDIFENGRITLLRRVK